MEIVATTSLPAVDRPNADRWNAARLCQKQVQQHQHHQQNNKTKKVTTLWVFTQLKLT